MPSEVKLTYEELMREVNSALDPNKTSLGITYRVKAYEYIEKIEERTGEGIIQEFPLYWADEPKSIGGETFKPNPQGEIRIKSQRRF